MRFKLLATSANWTSCHRRWRGRALGAFQL